MWLFCILDRFGHFAADGKEGVRRNKLSKPSFDLHSPDIQTVLAVRQSPDMLHVIDVQFDCCPSTTRT